MLPTMDEIRRPDQWIVRAGGRLAPV